MTRKSLGDITRKLSVTESRNCAQFLGTLRRRNPSAASANWEKVAIRRAVAGRDQNLDGRKGTADLLIRMSAGVLSKRSSETVRNAVHRIMSAITGMLSVMRRMTVRDGPKSAIGNRIRELRVTDGQESGCCFDAQRHWRVSIVACHRKRFD